MWSWESTWCGLGSQPDMVWESAWCGLGNQPDVVWESVWHGLGVSLTWSGNELVHTTVLTNIVWNHRHEEMAETLDNSVREFRHMCDRASLPTQVMGGGPVHVAWVLPASLTEAGNQQRCQQQQGIEQERNYQRPLQQRDIWILTCFGNCGFLWKYCIVGIRTHIVPMLVLSCINVYTKYYWNIMYYCS